MGNIMIYGGAAVMLVGCVFGLIAAFKGVRRKKGLNAFMPGFSAKMDPDVKRSVILWGVLMIIGFVMVGSGIAISL